MSEEEVVDDFEEVTPGEVALHEYGVVPEHSDGVESLSAEEFAQIRERLVIGYGKYDSVLERLAKEKRLVITSLPIGLWTRIQKTWPHQAHRRQITRRPIRHLVWLE